MFKLLTLRVFSGFCCLCDGSGHDGLDLCEICLASLKRNQNCCFRCALPLDYHIDNTLNLCGSCLTSKQRITHTFAPYIFDYPTNYIVRSLKFQQEEKYARLMGELLAKRVLLSGVTLPQCLIPVPLHRQRYLDRGFNQAELIAKFCAQRLGLKVVRNQLERIQDTAPQSSLGRRLRRQNVKGAFKILQGTAPLAKHIVLIDDVITTGSTVDEVSKLLLKAGVERVDVWAFSRAIKSVD